jgi:hypothetical protein
MLELHERGVLRVTGVSGEVYLFRYLDECTTIHYGPAGRVDQPDASL